MSRTLWALPFLGLLILAAGAAGSAAAPGRSAGCATAGTMIDAGPGGRVFYELRGSVSGTSSSLLAQGREVAPGSLALAGSTLYWTQAGTPRSAPL